MKLKLAGEISRLGAYKPMSKTRLHASKLVKKSAKACAFELYKPEKMSNPNIMALLRGNGFANQVLATCTYKEVCGEFGNIVFSIDAVHKPDNAIIECKYCGNSNGSAEIPKEFFGRSLAQLAFYAALYSKTTKTVQYKGKACAKLKSPISLLIMGLRNSIELWGFEFSNLELALIESFYNEKVEAIILAAHGDWSDANDWDESYPEGDWQFILKKLGIDQSILKGSTILENATFGPPNKSISRR